MKSQSWNMPPYLKQQAGPTTSSASPLSDKPKKRKSTVDTGTGNHKRQREIAIHDSHINFANIGGMTTVLEVFDFFLKKVYCTSLVSDCEIILLIL